METYNGIAKNIIQAREAAGNFFQINFGHSGKVGEERRFTTHCGCGESAAVEFYSKDDPAMADTFTAIICEACYESASNTQRV